MRKHPFRHSSVFELLFIVVIGVFIIFIVASGLLDNRNASSMATPSMATGVSGMQAEDAAPSVEVVTAVAVTPTGSVRDVIDVPSSVSGDLTLYVTDLTPRVTEEDAVRIARQSASQTGDPASVVFGLATFGGPGTNGKHWWGPENIPLPNGEILDHIERRPMWIVDFGGMRIPSACPDAGCPAYVSHAVYAVDDATRAVIWIWTYDPQLP